MEEKDLCMKAILTPLRRADRKHSCRLNEALFRGLILDKHPLFYHISPSSTKEPSHFNVPSYPMHPSISTGGAPVCGPPKTSDPPGRYFAFRDRIRRLCRQERSKMKGCVSNPPWLSIRTGRAKPGLNQRPIELQSIALPLSY